jgi:hypothetical protein
MLIFWYCPDSLLPVEIRQRIAIVRWRFAVKPQAVGAV